MQISVLCVVPSPFPLDSSCCSTSSSSQFLSPPVRGWGRVVCLTEPSGEGNFLLPAPKSTLSSPWGKIRYLWWSTESCDLLVRPSGWQGGKDLSDSCWKFSTRAGALDMWMSPAWSVDTVPPALSAEDDDEDGKSPNWEPVLFWSYVTGRKETQTKKEVGQTAREAEKQARQTANTHKIERITLTNHRLPDWLHFLSIKGQPISSVAACITKPCLPPPNAQWTSCSQNTHSTNLLPLFQIEDIWTNLTFLMTNNWEATANIHGMCKILWMSVLYCNFFYSELSMFVGCWDWPRPPHVPVQDKGLKILNRSPSTFRFLSQASSPWNDCQFWISW